MAKFLQVLTYLCAQNFVNASMLTSFNSLQSHTTDTITFQLGKQNLIVKRVNCFRKILNHSYSSFTFEG